MKLCITGRTPLTIPPTAPILGKFSGDTPYLDKVVSRLSQPSYRNGKLPLKLLCLTAIRERLDQLGGYKTFCEPLAGVGLSARIFEEEDVTLHLNDYDDGCAAVLRKNFGSAKITQKDAFNTELPSADVVFVDFNDLTFKRMLGKYRTVLEQRALEAKKYLIINDCSLFYFRYGASSFETYSKLMGMPIKSVQDYFKAVDQWYRQLGLQLLGAYYFSETAFLLLKKEGKTQKRLNIEVQGFTKEEIPVGFFKVVP